MGDQLPTKKIKTEPIDKENDIEHAIPTFVLKPPTSLLESSVEVIDLTEEQFLNEFKSFLTTLPERRVDKDARKNTTKAKSKASQRTQCMPIDYLEHVCFQQDTFICELFDFTFTNVMLYGRVTAETVKDDVVIYRLDDGTGAVDIFYRPGNKKYSDNLTKLEYCDDLLRRKNTPFNEESVPESAELRKHLRLLIQIAKAQCTKRLNRIKLGTLCFVAGNPFMGREDKVCVFAHSMFPDDELGRSCELFWKTHLLNIYEPLLTSEDVPTVDSDNSSGKNITEVNDNHLGV
ncbi:uncharacterized protein LOC131294617 [Anopheles ziemanni]|uniref:uncharacterized protein LOC131263071 n=1 Tax=Anopheles coustani TaxID=139045 RepID=UPI00265908ED|nr:uncharacterized protein LOC131263071 [Anopheles coustani]XP_058178645.1 uncharacterized protein LOC131294617 [Anopheles ziemanni]